MSMQVGTYERSTAGIRHGEGLSQILGAVQRKGVRLWAENGQLLYRAPKGALTEQEIARLKESKDEIVVLLEQTARTEIGEPEVRPLRRLDRAPLSFSQLAHWNLYRLKERPAIRQIACATRVRGRLNVSALKVSLAEAVSRHDALRTRIVLCDGVPMQVISASARVEFEVEDLSELADEVRDVEVGRSIERLILEPIDVSVGPMFGAKLLKLRPDEHMLIVAMEHMISDAFSMGVLLQELVAAYVQTVQGRSISLPAMRMQFAEYATQARNSHLSWLRAHGPYWNTRLAGCGRQRFPGELSSPGTVAIGWGGIPVRIPRELKSELREWCRVRRTTLALSVFTAYVALVLRWCNVSATVLHYQIDGRNTAELQNTIGYLTSALYLRVTLTEGDTFISLMNRLTAEYCSAYEHADCSSLDAQIPPPPFVRNTGFNWIPLGQAIDVSALAQSADAITCSPAPFPHPMIEGLQRDNEPVVVLFDTEEEVLGDLYFPADRFCPDAMERLAANFMMFIRILLRQPDRLVRDIRLG